MKVLDIKIENSEILPISDISGLIKSDTSYVAFSVNIVDKEWQYCDRVALLFEVDKKQYMVPITDKTTELPSDVSKERYYTIRAIGLSGTTKLATKNKLLIEQEEI